jgi:parvulin-like peptidyl-prolyl isomerase
MGVMQVKLRNNVLAAAAVIAACVCLPAESEILDKIVAVVNDEVITQGEIDSRLGGFIQEQRSVYGDNIPLEKINEARFKVLQLLISDKLVISQAKRKKIVVSEKEVNGQVERVKKNFPSEEVFYQALEKQGLAVDTLKENYRTNLMAQKLVEKEIRSKIIVTPQDVFKYYSDNKAEFTEPKMAKARIVTIKAGSARDDATAKQMAENILIRIKNGENFSELAREFSEDTYAKDGGDMGFVKKGDMMSKIDEAIFSLKTFQFSQVIKTDLGYHIFKVEEIKQPELLKFDTVSKDIEHIIFYKKLDERTKNYIEKLKESAYIEYK